MKYLVKVGGDIYVREECSAGFEHLDPYELKELNIIGVRVNPKMPLLPYLSRLVNKFKERGRSYDEENCNDRINLLWEKGELEIPLSKIQRLKHFDFFVRKCRELAYVYEGFFKEGLEKKFVRFTFNDRKIFLENKEVLGRAVKSVFKFNEVYNSGEYPALEIAYVGHPGVKFEGTREDVIIDKWIREVREKEFKDREAELFESFKEYVIEPSIFHGLDSVKIDVLLRIAENSPDGTFLEAIVEDIENKSSVNKPCECSAIGGLAGEVDASLDLLLEKEFIEEVEDSEGGRGGYVIRNEYLKARYKRGPERRVDAPGQLIMFEIS